MPFYKIGGLILNSSSEYVKNCYKEVDNPFKSEYDYNKQFIPLLYTNNIKIEILQSQNINLNVHSIYYDICDKLDIKYEKFKYKNMCFINHNFISKHIFKTLPPNIKDHIISLTIYKLINNENFSDIFTDDYYSSCIYKCNYTSHQYYDEYFKEIENENENKFTDNINYIYTNNISVLDIPDVNDIYDKIIDKLKLYDKFINGNSLNLSNKSNKTISILNCTMIEILAILLDRLEININFYNFDYDSLNEQFIKVNNKYNEIIKLYSKNDNRFKPFMKNIINNLNGNNIIINDYKNYSNMSIDVTNNDKLTYTCKSSKEITDKTLYLIYYDEMYNYRLENIKNIKYLYMPNTYNFIEIENNNNNNNNNNQINMSFDDIIINKIVSVNSKYDNYIAYTDLNKINKTNKTWQDNLIFCYSRLISFYKPKVNNLTNNYLSDIIVNSSNVFNDFSKEYSNDEIKTLDLRNELKDYDKFNELFKDSKTSAQTIHHLIIYIKSNLIDNDFNNIIYNLYYLQMTEIIEIIDMISMKFLTMN